MVAIIVMKVPPKRNIAVQVSELIQILPSENLFSLLEAENESIERELEKQFNEGLQAKVAHAHHEGLGFHGESTGLTSSAGDWHSQSTK
ncbi:unnamed protein product, partial [Rotaria magnacalcarata]